jgi:small subunit ribosomal protein S6
MRRYELMLLLRPDLEDDKLQAAVEKVTRAIVNGGGSLSKVSPWGKRRLAYDIGTHREASYFLIHFDIEPAQVREIERGMLISEEILRHLVTVIEDRGPADEIAPAAAARSGGFDDQPGDDAATADDDADGDRAATQTARGETAPAATAVRAEDEPTAEVAEEEPAAADADAEEEPS